MKEAESPQVKESPQTSGPLGKYVEVKLLYLDPHRKTRIEINLLNRADRILHDSRLRIFHLPQPSGTNHPNHNQH